MAVPKKRSSKSKTFHRKKNWKNKSKYWRDLAAKIGMTLMKIKK